jgi:hypothetical protein
MRDIDDIDSELRLLVAIRHTVWETEDRPSKLEPSRYKSSL